MDETTVTACAAAFCAAVSAGGYTPALYCNGMLGYFSYDLEQLAGILIWYAEYSSYPSYAYQIGMWQYTDTGAVAGVSGKVDRDIWFVPESTEAAAAGSGSASSASSDAGS